ncbi:MAG: mechanosensitive ion channel family protein [Myxococcales bacterium]|nr:mechanosensitive ion channel family protein [Myxococcales bacterium]HIK85685.1 mechanosensitive ion channel family protein [Myxococcales bacterium]
MEDWISAAQYAQDLAWVRALEVIILSVLVAKISDLAIARILIRLSLSTKTDFDDQLVQVLHRPIFLSVFLAGFFVAANILEPSENVANFLIPLIQTIAILVWTIAASRISSIVLGGLSRLADRVTWLESRTLPLFDNLNKILVFGVSTYAILVAWDLDLSGWLASAGIMGIAVGFAAKDSLANLFGGLFVIMDAPYKIGDYINLDSGERGRVVRIGLRSTRLLTRDDVEITLPNSHIANAKVVNESGGPYEMTRIAISVGVAYGSDIDQVREVLMAAAESVEHVVSDPEPRIRFIEMGDSALIFRIQGWIDEPALRGICIDRLNTAVYKALGQSEIEIPFPQRVVHIAATH